MSKSNKIFTSIILGAVGGAAAALFLASKTGKAVKEKVTGFAKDYKENPEAKHSEWADKATEFKHQATEKYDDVKHKIKTGELSADSLVNSVKEKASELKERMTQEDFFSKATDQEGEEEPVDDDVDETVTTEDLTIEFQPKDDTTQEDADTGVGVKENKSTEK